MYVSMAITSPSRLGAGSRDDLRQIVLGICPFNDYESSNHELDTVTSA
jgi:hypothetical protein